MNEAAWADIVLHSRAKQKLRELNPQLPGENVDQALAEILSPKSQDAMAENQRLHEYLVHGCRGITYYDRDGQDQTPTIRLVSHQVHENDWLAVNQVTIRSRDVDRRFDLVPYLNGFPGSVIEFKQAGGGGRPGRRACPAGDVTPRVPGW